MKLIEGSLQIWLAPGNAGAWRWKIVTASYEVIGRRKISHFIEDLVRPHVRRRDLDKAYEQMGKDEVREKDATDWCEGLTGGASAIIPCYVNLLGNC
jgi:hypothetical protein